MRSLGSPPHVSARQFLHGRGACLVHSAPDKTMSCLVERVKRASFEPHNGGTLRIHVPFSLRRVAPGDETF